MTHHFFVLVFGLILGIAVVLTLALLAGFAFDVAVVLILVLAFGTRLSLIVYGP